ncbi:MAG: thioredoxin family protein [Bacteroidia bacterium]
MNKLIKLGSLTILMVALVATSSFKPSEKKAPEIPGIKFFHGSLKEAKAKAKKENKLIFIDCYTTWCGPCKSMAKKTFVNKEVGEYFNKNFICLKIDMEQGEGPALAGSYSVEAYPTYLFIDSKGTLKHRDLGFIDASRFIEVGKTALSK